jgi:hypothetical protein
MSPSANPHSSAAGRQKQPQVNRLLSLVQSCGESARATSNLNTKHARAPPIGTLQRRMRGQSQTAGLYLSVPGSSILYFKQVDDIAQQQRPLVCRYRRVSLQQHIETGCS